MYAQTLRSGLLLTALAAGVLAGSIGPAQGSSQTKNVSMTRSMAVFFRFERDLANAIAEHDASATDALLAEGFELRSSGNPTEPTVRADWLKMPSAGVAGEVEQLTVHDHGVLSIASFIKTTPSSSDDSVNDRAYIVDVWQKHGDGWQLLTRYQSPLPAEAVQQEDVAPTGRG